MKYIFCFSIIQINISLKLNDKRYEIYIATTYVNGITWLPSLEATSLKHSASVEDINSTIRSEMSV